MATHPRFQDYYWVDGMPKGVGLEAHAPYRIVADPYQKWITIEKYRRDHLEEVVYDSHLLDFRHLKIHNQVGHRREELLNTPNLTKTWVFNADDRAIYQEERFFEKGRCRHIRILYPCGRLLCIYHQFYHKLGDPFDGVILADAHDHPVMCQKYKTSHSGEWEVLEEERWALTSPLSVDSVAQMLVC